MQHHHSSRIVISVHLTSRALTIAALATVLAGCASTTVDRVAEHPPKEEGCVLDVYDNERQPPRSWDPICYIETKSGSHLFADRSEAGTIAQLKEEACACGADGLILDGRDQTSATLYSWGEGRGSGRAIKYRNPAQ